MNTFKTISENAKQRIPRSQKPKILKKFKSTREVDFFITKDVNFDDIEIRITVKGNEILTKLLHKGLQVGAQVVLVKTKPTPPPIPVVEIIEAISKLRLIFKNKR